MSISISFSARCCNLSRWERFGLVEREGSTSNLLHLALAMAMVTFRYFSGHVTDPLLSGLTGAFFAREMHSTSEFAKIVLSKCVVHAGFVMVA